MITRAILCSIFIPPEALLTDAVQAGEKGGSGDVGARYHLGAVAARMKQEKLAVVGFRLMEKI